MKECERPGWCSALKVNRPQLAEPFTEPEPKGDVEMNLEKAFMLLHVLEKASSHHAIRGEALRQLNEIDAECKAEQAKLAAENKVRQDEEAERYRKAQEEANKDPLNDPDSPESQMAARKKADEERAKVLANRPFEDKAKVDTEQVPKVDPAAASEPVVERRL